MGIYVILVMDLKEYMIVYIFLSMIVINGLFVCLVKFWENICLDFLDVKGYFIVGYYVLRVYI